MKTNKYKKDKVMKIIGIIGLDLFWIIFRISIMLTFVGFFIVFINANIEYFKELPTIILLAIPIGLVGIIIEILCRTWRKPNKFLRK